MKAGKKIVSTIILCLVSAGFLSAWSQHLVRYYNHSYVGFSGGVGKARYIIADNEAVGKNKELSLDVATVNGIQVKKHQLGIGVGADVWKSRWFIPLFFSYSFTFLNKKVSPHMGMDIGYAFGKIKGDFYIGDENGSVLFRPFFGVQAKLTPKLFLVTHAFYKRQAIRTSYYSGGYNPTPANAGARTNYLMGYHFLGIDVGIKL